MRKWKTGIVRPNVLYQIEVSKFWGSTSFVRQIMCNEKIRNLTLVLTSIYYDPVKWQNSRPRNKEETETSDMFTDGLDDLRNERSRPNLSAHFGEMTWNQPNLDVRVVVDFILCWAAGGQVFLSLDMCVDFDWYDAQKSTLNTWPIDTESFKVFLRPISRFT